MAPGRTQRIFQYLQVLGKDIGEGHGVNGEWLQAEEWQIYIRH